MTVCIAANCASGKGVVVGSDRMISAPYLTLEFDHPDGKIDVIGPRCVALTAGDALTAQEILSGGAGLAGQLQDPLISHFAAHVRKQYVEARRRVATEPYLQPRGMSFDEFYVGGVINRLPGDLADLAMTLDAMIQRINLGVSVILAGVEGSGGHIYSIEDPGTVACFDRLGFHAIGSGHRHAMMALVNYGQHQTTDLNRTVFNVYCAKRSAEVAPGVGLATEIRIITPNRGVIALNQDDLDTLLPLYEKRSRPSLVDLDRGIDGYGLVEEITMKKTADRVPTSPARDMVRVIPSDVQLERAEQNRLLAEVRYDLAVRKGSAWRIDLPRIALGK
jgi:20S proteasome alpha/beta subunit